MQNTFLTQIFEKTRYLFRIFQYRVKQKYTPESSDQKQPATYMIIYLIFI